MERDQYWPTLLVRPASSFTSFPAEPPTAAPEVSPTAPGLLRSAEFSPTSTLESIAELLTSPTAMVTPTPRAAEMPQSILPRDLLVVLVFSLLGLLVLSLFGSKKS